MSKPLNCWRSKGTKHLFKSIPLYMSPKGVKLDRWLALGYHIWLKIYSLSDKATQTLFPFVCLTFQRWINTYGLMYSSKLPRKCQAFFVLCNMGKRPEKFPIFPRKNINIVQKSSIIIHLGGYNINLRTRKRERVLKTRKGRNKMNSISWKNPFNRRIENLSHINCSIGHECEECFLLACQYCGSQLDVCDCCNYRDCSFSDPICKTCNAQVKKNNYLNYLDSDSLYFDYFDSDSLDYFDYFDSDSLDYSENNNYDDFFEMILN